MTITEKVSYLKGLCEGLGIDESQKEGKMIKAIIDVLDDIAFSVADLEDGFAELCDQVDMIDEDLDGLEEDYYGDLDDEDEDDEDEDEELEDEELYEVQCPTCGNVICVNEDMLNEGQMNCPNCNELLEFTFDEDEAEGCDCDCGCDHHE